jgi:hypothetical protein
MHDETKRSEQRRTSGQKYRTDDLTCQFLESVKKIQSQHEKVLCSSSVSKLRLYDSRKAIPHQRANCSFHMNLQVQGQVGFVAKRKQQRRPRQADAFLFRPSVPRFDHLVSARA